AQGMLYTCLFATSGHDFRSLLREGASDEQLARQIESIWGRRADRYSELRNARPLPMPKVEMSYIGG
nr:GTP 3',8-cyclase MoaA [Gammaproteobacteria bacterium]